MSKLFTATDELAKTKNAPDNVLSELIRNCDGEAREYLFEKARAAARSYFGNKVYIRGLIEFTNYCRNDCYYCGIRRSNKNAERYRLTKDEILECCRSGYTLGFRTFVLQGGEDVFYSDEMICEIVRSIKSEFSDCAVTLSIGEKPRESYAAYRAAGADRYLLRHETACAEHYGRLHPAELTIENRIRCLRDLKELGFQTGCGFMVGSPYQTTENIIEDLRFIKNFEPHMIGIGPFIPHSETPFAEEGAGTLEQTLVLIAILRLMNPRALIPATTALGTVNPRGRELGILAGANVVMPNLSPVSARGKYMLYNGKLSSGAEAAECIENLNRRMTDIGYKIVTDRGDYK